MFSDKTVLMPADLRLFDGEGGVPAGEAAAGTAAGTVGTGENTAGTATADGAAEPPDAGAKAGANPAGTPDGRREIARRVMAGESVDLKSPAPQATGGDKGKTGVAAKPEPAKGSDAGSETRTQATQAESRRPDELPDIDTLTADERKALYQKVTRELLREEYTADTQRLIDQRFKEAKRLQTRLSEVQQLLDALSMVHGVTNVRQLTDKVKGEAVERLAQRANMDPATYADYLDAKAARERARQADEARAVRTAQDAIVKGWYDEAAQLTGTKDRPGVIPDLDLRREADNPDFVKLLQSGVSVKAAYEVVHFNDILNRKVEAAKKDAVSAVTQQIQARGSRPAENGAAASTGVIVKKEVRNLTVKDRAELARRAASGEEIVF